MDLLLIIGSAVVVILIVVIIVNKAREGKRKMGFKDRAKLESAFDPLERKKSEAGKKEIIPEVKIDADAELIIEEEPVSDPEPVFTEPVRPDAGLPEPPPSFLKGKLKFNSKDMNGAKQDFLNAVREDPDHAQTRFLLAKTYSKLKEYQEAIKEYTEAIRLQLENIDAFFERGYAQMMIKNYQSAVLDFDTYLIVKPDNADALLNRGQAKSFMEDYRGAVDDFSKIISLKPHHSQAYFERGLTKNKMGDKEGCCADLKKAFDEGHLEAHFHLKNICGEEIKLRKDD